MSDPVDHNSVDTGYTGYYKLLPITSEHDNSNRAQKAIVLVLASFPVLHHSYRHLQYKVIRTASDDSCGGGLGTRLLVLPCISKLG